MKLLRILIMGLTLAGCATSVPKRMVVRSLPPPGSVTLTIAPTNVVDTCMVGWVAGPPTMDGMVVAGGGSGTIFITNYTGPAVVLTAYGLNPSNGCFIEISTNLANWTPYPTNGFQLTLIATNPASVLIMDKAAAFFRGRIDLVNQ